MKKGLTFKKILGVRINSTSKLRVLKFVENQVKENKKVLIFTPNPEQLVLAHKDSNFLQVLNQADLCLPDGVGLVWAGRVLHCRIQERLSGVDLMLELCQLAAKRGWRVFLLGGGPDVARKAAERLAKSLKPKAKSHKPLAISYFAGAKDIKRETREERETTIKRINQFKPHLLFAAYGAPYQEEWLHQSLSKLNIRVGMVVGGSFDYLSGRLKRAPRFLQNLGLEWWWRLLQEPWRVKRQLRLLEFVWLVLRERAGKRISDF